MSSSFPLKIDAKPDLIVPRSRSRKATLWAVILVVASPSFSFSTALAQNNSYTRIALQLTRQEEPKQKVRISARKPLDSDAVYVCTLSGFGNLAHCYAR
jgi:hypothetical protein